MARLLIECFERSGHQVDVASHLRAFLRDPHSESDKNHLMEQAALEVQRLSALWEEQGPPALWFCYHPYFKSPDLIGPVMCERFDVPYVTAEASYSKRRTQGVWGPMQEQVLASINSAAVNICFTERDRLGLYNASNSASLTRLKPFIDTASFANETTRQDTPRLVAVAMMRSGDKMDSYVRLAMALEHITHLPWTLSVVGDGPAQTDVHAVFSQLPAERLEWHGQLEPPDIAALLAGCSLYVWPGCGEAYGLAYLEAQAAGVPVVAYETAGVPEVVDNGYSGVLTPEGDDEAYAAAIASLLDNPSKLAQMSSNALAHVRRSHSLEPASVAMQAILKRYVGIDSER